jgi:hypothetical protein
MNSSTEFVNPDNENNNTNNNSNIIIQQNNDNSWWNLILKYYKQILLFLSIFVIIYAIENINKYNLMNGAPVPSIPGLATAATMASNVINKKGKGKGKK